MPKAYWVITYRSVSDREKLAAYAELAVAATAPFGARILARGNPAVVYEDGLKERTVVTEYPSLEKATASYGSPAYQEALQALGDGAVRDVRIIEGLELVTLPFRRFPPPWSLRQWRCRRLHARRQPTISDFPFGTNPEPTSELVGAWGGRRALVTKFSGTITIAPSRTCKTSGTLPSRWHQSLNHMLARVAIERSQASGGGEDSVFVFFPLVRAFADVLVHVSDPPEEGRSVIKQLQLARLLHV